jgi:hypothetical protein
LLIEKFSYHLENYKFELYMWENEFVAGYGDSCLHFQLASRQRLGGAWEEKKLSELHLNK